MRCKDFDYRLQRLLDVRRAPERDGQLIAHAQCCESCRNILETQQLLFDGLDFFEAEGTDAGFSRRVLAGLSRQRPERPAAWRVAMSLAAAAVLLMAAIPALRSNRRPEVADQTVAPTMTSRGAEVEIELPPIQEMAADPSTPEAAAEPLVPPSEHTSRGVYSLASWGQIRIDLSDQQRRNVDNLAGGLRPIATSLNVAFNVLRKTMPGCRPARPEKPQARVSRAPSPQGLV